MTIISLLIIDDHSIVRAGIKSTLCNSKLIQVVGEAIDGKQGLDKIKELNPHVVILDLSIPVVSGMKVVEFIKENLPWIKILIFTMHDDAPTILTTIESGVNGYLLKNTDLNEVEKAIRAVHSGDNYFNQHISNIMADAIRYKNETSSKTTENTLSEREKEVLLNIVYGLSNKMIAEKLSISENTVANHRTSIMKKTNSSNTADLVRRAISDKLI